MMKSKGKTLSKSSPPTVVATPTSRISPTEGHSCESEVPRKAQDDISLKEFNGSADQPGSDLDAAVGRLAQLRDKGILTDLEFEQEKRHILEN